jgi:hypothetical protein
MARRRVFLPLDKLIVGAASTEPRRPFLTMPKPAVPLNEAEEQKLTELRLKLATFGRLEPEERYKYEQLSARPRRTR